MEIPQSIMQPVIEYFNGDIEKVTSWINADNPMLGGVSPCDMILMGRADSLQKFVDTQIAFNGEANGNPASAPLISRTVDEDGHKVVILSEWYYEHIMGLIKDGDAPTVDIEALKLPYTETKDGTIHEDYTEGWNDCVEKLASQGFLTGKGEE